MHLFLPPPDRYISKRRPPRDSVSKNAVVKFEATLAKKYAAKLEGFSEEELRQLEDLSDLFSFLDGILPDDEEDTQPAPKRAPKKRYATSWGYAFRC